jgi:TolB-like protein
MRYLYLIVGFLLSHSVVFGQVNRVAILDFENISGIPKYDGLGKAMSSMLISDIEANVSPKRLQLIERSQVQKILKEQNFQASGSVSKSSAVKAGKLLGVNYLLVGDVYILNDQLIINARLTNTETGEIVFSKKQEGKTLGWLTLKTNIAKDLSSSLSQPFISPTIPDKEITVATVTTFGNAIAAKDKGDTSLAEKLVQTIEDFSPEFKYIDDLKKEINLIKEQLLIQSNKINVLEKSGGRVVNAKTYTECYNNLINPLTDDSSAIVYLEYIIDNFPKEAIENKNALFAYPLIWVDTKWHNYISFKKNIITDFNRMTSHIQLTKNKFVASLIYATRTNAILHRTKLDAGDFKNIDVQKSLIELKILIEKYVAPNKFVKPTKDNFDICKDIVQSLLFDDSTKSIALEYIIDYYPNDNFYPNEINYTFFNVFENISDVNFFDNKNAVIANLNRIKSHLSKTTNKKIAKKIYKNRIGYMELFLNKLDDTNDKDILISSLLKDINDIVVQE